MTKTCLRALPSRLLGSLLVTGIGLLMAPPAMSVPLVPGDVIALISGASGAGEIVRIDRSTGTKTVLAYGGGLGLAVARDRSIYVSGGPGLYRVDAATGATTVLFSSYELGYITDVDVSPDGRLLTLSKQFREYAPGQYVESIRVYEIDPMTGVADLLAMQEPEYASGRLAATADGNAYFTNLDMGVYFADASIGTVDYFSIVLEGSSLMAEDARGIALHADGSFSVAIRRVGGSPYHEIYRVDPDTGTATLVNGAQEWNALAVDLDSDLLATSGFGALYEIDRVTGIADLISDESEFIDVAVVPIPEPSTAPLVGIGLLVLSARGRRARWPGGLLAHLVASLRGLQALHVLR